MMSDDHLSADVENSNVENVMAQMQMKINDAHYDDRIKEKCNGGLDLHKDTLLGQWEKFRHSVTSNLYQDLWKKFEEQDKEREARTQKLNCRKSGSKWVICQTPSIEETYFYIENLKNGTYGGTDVVIARSTNASFICKSIAKTKVPPQHRQTLYKRIRKEVAFYVLGCDILCFPEIHEAFEDNHFVYLIFDFFPRGDFEFNIIEHIAENEADIHKSFFQMCQCVFPIHQQGLYHGDLRLDKFFVKGIIQLGEYSTKESSLVLGNFNFVKNMFRRKSRQRHVKLLYSAPECFYGKFRKETDIWSLGIILFTLAFNYMPFMSFEVKYEEFSKDLQKQIMNGFKNEIKTGKGPHFPKEKVISIELRDLISHMLCSNAEERLNITQIFEHPWMLQNSYKETLHQNLSESVFLLHRGPKFIRTLMLGILQNPEGLINIDLQKMYHRAYGILDVDGSGIFEKKILKDCLKQKYDHLKDEELEQIVLICEDENSGQIKLDVLINFKIICCLVERYIKEITKAFEELDEDGTGKLTTQEFSACLDDLLGDLSDDASAEEITEDFREISGIAKNSEEPCNWHTFLKHINDIIDYEAIGAEISETKVRREKEIIEAKLFEQMQEELGFV